VRRVGKIATGLTLPFLDPKLGSQNGSEGHAAFRQQPLGLDLVECLAAECGLLAGEAQFFDTTSLTNRRRLSGTPRSSKRS
jgi:hypothetical protein